jgi:hypothetical protein
VSGPKAHRVCTNGDRAFRVRSDRRRWSSAAGCAPQESARCGPALGPQDGLLEPDVVRAAPAWDKNCASAALAFASTAVVPGGNGTAWDIVARRENCARPRESFRRIARRCIEQALQRRTIPGDGVDSPGIEGFALVTKMIAITSALLSTALMGVFGWIIKRLVSPPIRDEFVGAR